MPARANHPEHHQGMREFLFTFGVKYSDETPHPAGGHADGWFVIEAEDETSARAKMNEVSGRKWAFCYTRKPDAVNFSRGELKRFKV